MSPIIRFEDLAELYQFEEATKKLHFQSLFEGKPLEILHRLDASDKTYLSMKSALMRACGLTVDEAKLQFNRAMMQDKETAAQFLVRFRLPGSMAGEGWDAEHEGRSQRFGVTVSAGEVMSSGSRCPI